MKFLHALSVLFFAGSASGQCSMQCSSDVLTCPTGEVYNRDPCQGCQFPKCPTNCDAESSGQGTNYLICRNSLTTRDPNGNPRCEFTPCDGGCLLTDYRQCPAPNLHLYVARNPASNCQSYLSCPSGPAHLPAATLSTNNTNATAPDANGTAPPKDPEDHEDKSDAVNVVSHTIARAFLIACFWLCGINALN